MNNNNHSKVFKVINVELVEGGESTLLAVENARAEFIDYTNYKPEELVLTAQNYRTLLSDPLTKYQPYPKETFMGMKIVVDPNLKEGEWKLVKQVKKDTINR